MGASQARREAGGVASGYVEAEQHRMRRPQPPLATGDLPTRCSRSCYGLAMVHLQERRSGRGVLLWLSAALVGCASGASSGEVAPLLGGDQRVIITGGTGLTGLS